MNKFKKADILEKTRWRPLEDIFGVALTLNLFVLLSTSHVPSFMLLSQNARFFSKLLHIRPTKKTSDAQVSYQGVFHFQHINTHYYNSNLIWHTVSH